jgi:hypothetical protein
MALAEPIRKFHMVRHITRSIPFRRLGILCLTLAASTAAGQKQPAAAPTCQVAGSLVRVPDLAEASGIAASRQSPGRLWAHNDSGEPELLALDSRGTVVHRLRVGGAEMRDWEAVAVGPCPAGSCIYIGDIGDNDARRQSITIYRIPERTNAPGSVGNAEAFGATYPGGAQDAEALLVTPGGDVVIVTKGDTGPVALYRLPSDAKPGSRATLQPIGQPRGSGKAANDEWITDGAVSPNGEWVALRTKSAILFYRSKDLLSGNWKESGRVSVKALGEPQGEGIAFGDDRAVYLVGEGGGKSQPGTFGRLTCDF